MTFKSPSWGSDWVAKILEIPLSQNSGSRTASRIWQIERDLQDLGHR